MIDVQQIVPPCSCLPPMFSQHRSWASLQVWFCCENIKPSQTQYEVVSATRCRVRPMHNWIKWQTLSYYQKPPGVFHSCSMLWNASRRWPAISLRHSLGGWALCSFLPFQRLGINGLATQSPKTSCWCEAVISNPCALSIRWFWMLWFNMA